MNVLHPLPASSVFKWRRWIIKITLNRRLVLAILDLKEELTVRNHHLKTGDVQEEHWLNVSTDIGNIEDPSVKPNRKGVMNISADINLSTTYDNKRKKFVHYESRRQPFLLCQVQEFRAEGGIEGFKPRKVKVGRFLADTGAQVNECNYTLFDLMGIPQSEAQRLTRDASYMKIHGIGGDILSLGHNGPLTENQEVSASNILHIKRSRLQYHKRITGLRTRIYTRKCIQGKLSVHLQWRSRG